MEFLKYGRWRKPSFEPMRDKLFDVQDHNPEATWHWLEFAPGAKALVCVATQDLPRKLDRGAKLALEFAGRPEYAEVTVTAVNAVVRDMKRHQTLAIA